MECFNYILDQATDKGASWVDDDPPTQAYLDKLERLLQLLQVKGVDLKTGTLFVELFHQWEAGVFSHGNMNGKAAPLPPLGSAASCSVLVLPVVLLDSHGGNTRLCRAEQGVCIPSIRQGSSEEEAPQRSPHARPHGQPVSALGQNY